MPHHLLHHWNESAIDNWERAAPLPGDDPYARIAMVSPLLTVPDAVAIIPSWAADTPPDSWIEVNVRAQQNGIWSNWYRLAAWDADGSRRASFDRQRDDCGFVATDTVKLTAPAQAVQARVLLCGRPGADMPSVTDLFLCVTTTASPAIAAEPPALSAIDLPLLLCQYDYPGGEGWCSPTAVHMVLAYWHAQLLDPRLAPFADPATLPDLTVAGIFDPGWDGTGNWSFNTAFAARFGLRAYVTRFDTLEQIGRWTAAGVPVIISLAWEPGQIDDAPRRTDGHLTIVRGFSHTHALIAEPAGRDRLLRAYPQAQLAEAWQANSAGTVYLIYPPDWPRPQPGLSDAWV
ncbi:C39 family peptidase [Chloroflexus sp.]|uniref:C39 family peptidase n=1 Tax=Chloroflexus sp. TaxID=1904827 RepID=UPI002613F446|nr:C39 family peptidase [uncultured Chloroflexus sp.]